MAYASTLLARVAEHADSRPAAVALVMGTEQVTYGELGAMTRAAGARLAELNLTPDRRVAIHAAKSPRTIALIIACLRARLPFLLPSAELGAGTFTALLDRAGCTDLLATEAPAEAAGRTVQLIDCAPSTGKALVAGEPEQRDMTFMLTTSGSTGLPKVVPLTAGAVERFTDWAADQFDLGPDSTVLNYAPLNFDLCLLDIWATLKAGGTVVLVEQDKATNGQHLAELIRTNRVDLVQSVPMLFRLLADAWDGKPNVAVRNVILTGDKVSARLLKEIPELFPWSRVWNLYGCTETNDSFLHEIPRDAGDSPDVPIGRPLPGVEALVVGEDGTVLDGPASGELFVRTPFQTLGYLDASVAAEKFVHLDGLPDVYFRSGDLVQRDPDGVFTLLGRNDFQVKVRGTRVNLEEVEHVILDHEQIVEAAVIGIPDELAGIRIHAVVRGTAPGSPNSLALRNHCRLRLPRVAIPAAIQIVNEPLPRTSTGKVDRQAIRRDLLNRS
jgi:amino acid adenylation domain-containing protein